MPERLVDVETQGSQVLHTFPVTISAPAAEEDAFKEKALEAAGNAKLVPNEELDSLNAKMHVSRSGQLTPYGDPHGVPLRCRRTIREAAASGGGVAPQLSGDCRCHSPEPASDLLHGVALNAKERDLLPLRKREIPTTERLRR